jgi:Fructose-2,6-bisphosphatase
MSEPQFPQYFALVRHGESFANILTERPTDALYYEVSGSDKNVDITPRGVEQIEHRGNMIHRLFPAENPVQTVHISEFKRVRRSGCIIKKKLGYRVDTLTDARLNKRSYGKFWNLTYRGVKTLHPEQFEIFKSLGPMKYRPPGGENYFDLFERVEEYLDSVINPSSGHQLLVGHLVVILAFQRLLEGLPDSEVVRQYERVLLPNGHVILYVRESPTSGWKRAYVSDLLSGQ